jgi:hypothetical protein
MNGNYNYCNNIFLHRIEKNKILGCNCHKKKLTQPPAAKKKLGDTTNNDSAVQGMKESGGAHGVVFLTFLPRSN